MIDDFPESRARNLRNFTGSRRVDSIEERREGGAQADAAPAAVAVVEHAVQLAVEHAGNERARSAADEPAPGAGTTVPSAS